jgi:pimeloyl-ACP methyl ester carboxylesterase
MATVSSRGFTIDYSTSGRGPAVLLVCGLSQWAGQWHDLGYVDALAGQFRVITFDVLGHGDSDKPHDVGAYNPRDLLTDMVAVLDAAGADTVTAWGFSFGVQHVTDLASVAPERVRGLVCGSGGLRPRAYDVRVNSENMASRMRAPGGLEMAWKGVGFTDPEAVAIGLTHNDREALACWCEARPLWRPDSLPLGKIPAIAYWGSDEDLPDGFERADEMGIPHTVIPGADHFGAFARTDEALAIVVPFLGQTAS